MQDKDCARREEIASALAFLKKQNRTFLKHIAPGSTLGIRIPDSDFCREIQKSNLPFITTSVNLAKQKPANKISEIKKQIKDKVDIIIDAGTLSGKPSTLIINRELVRRR